MKKVVAIVSLLGLMLGCQLKPTKVTEQEPVISEGATSESLMKGTPVILDVRASFEFNIAHVPGAVNVRWEDFSQSHPKFRGLLQTDLFSLARRLSLIGIDPQTKVLILGKGPQGMGEEGRIAWTLQVLGVKNVHTLVHTTYRPLNTHRETPPIQNKAYWKPQVDESLMISLKDFKAQVSATNPSALILDVRLPEEFALRNLSSDKKVKAKILNIPWTDFFDDTGLVKKDLEKVLAEKGLTKNSSLLVMSSHGVRSGAVTYALRSQGFEGARNFAGGYEQWK